MIRSVIVDIDGTIAECEERAQAFLTRKKDWERFYEEAENDKPIKEIIKIVKALQDLGHPLIFLTGRPEKYRSQTVNWLKKQGFLENPNYTTLLLMRKDKDHRTDYVIKLEHYKELKSQGVKVLCVFEDRKQVVEMWREQGLVCLQVKEGDY